MSTRGEHSVGLAGRTGSHRRHRLDAARLYLILEAEPHGRPADEILRPALAGGVDLVQLRDKDADDDALLCAAREFRAACDEHDALLVLNDRPDLALECGADGVHLGQDDASVDEARALLGADALVGVSTHTPGQIAAARRWLADYIGVGPVYATPTKPRARPVGEGLVRHAKERSERPFFAIGGIDVHNVRSVVAAGATRIAVIRAIRDADDPRAAAEALLSAIIRETTDRGRK
jgi:thiamine-phosphate pyrophosphorylase